jgi:hypothetical protein
MCRNLADPFDAAVFQRGGGVEAMGDGVVDEALFEVGVVGDFLGEESDLAVEGGGVGVEVGGDGALFGKGGKGVRASVKQMCLSPHG